jgi:hypothetical protein
MKEMWPWLTLALLGAYHGLNPGMGWLFAVALGLQERSRRAVIRAFTPIALGHAASIGVVVGLVAMLQSVISPVLLRYAGASVLVAYGLYKLLAPMSHPRWVGMRVGFRDLTVWSFLMATAHGAGLMLVPVLLKLTPDAKPATQVKLAVRTIAAQSSCHTSPALRTETAGRVEVTLVGQKAGSPQDIDRTSSDCHAHLQQAATSGGNPGVFTTAAAVTLHTGAMFLVMAMIAVLVYEKIGLAILRRAWFNLDLLWAGALIGAGVLTILL